MDRVKGRPSSLGGGAIVNLDVTCPPKLLLEMMQESSGRKGAGCEGLDLTVRQSSGGDWLGGNCGQVGVAGGDGSLTCAFGVCILSSVRASW